MANSILAKLAVQISANTAQFNKSLKESSSSLAKFQSSVSDSIKGLVAGFGAMQIAQFTLDVSKLAGEAEGVKRAFDKLPNSVRVMNELKAVTAGTVSELELMKRAVTATNFGIELEQLPKLLEFATVRAQQTGQSVDYLVDSIVTGIGRKSPLILDNLGISTTRLKDKFNGAALEAQNIADVAKAVGEIAEEELGKMGKMSENAATRMARLNAEWVNLKVAIGNAANAADSNQAFSIAKMTEDLTALFKVLQDNEIANQISQRDGGFWAYLFPNLDQLFSVRELAKEIENVKKTTEDLAKINTEGFVKVPGLGLKIQQEIDKLTQQNTENEKKKLEVKKSQLQVEAELLSLAAKERLKGFQFSAGPTVAGFDRSQLTFEKPDDKSIQSMANAQDALAAATERANQKQQIQNDLVREQQAVFANAAISIGDAIGSAISANESFAQVMIKTTQVIIDQIQKQVIANIVAGSSKLFAANPLLGIGVVGLAGGIIKGLLGKIGGGAGGYSAVGAVRPSFSRASVGMVQSSVVVTGVIRGQDIYLSNQNYQKASGYTKG